MNQTSAAPWKVDFHQGEILLDSTLVAYGLDDVLPWARARYAGIRELRGTDITVRLSSGSTVMDHDAVLAEFGWRHPGVPWQQEEPVRLALLQEIHRDVVSSPDGQQT